MEEKDKTETGRHRGFVTYFTVFSSIWYNTVVTGAMLLSNSVNFVKKSVRGVMSFFLLFLPDRSHSGGRSLPRHWLRSLPAV